MEGCSKNFTDRLPEEALATIFSFLKPRDLAKVSLVCELWNRVGSDDVVWKQQSQLPGKNLKETLKERNSIIQFVIQNEEAEIIGHFSTTKKIFPKELVEFLKNPEINIGEKSKALDDHLNKKIEVVCPYNGQTIPMSMFQFILPYMSHDDGNYLGLEILLKAGANPNLIDRNFPAISTPLINAAFHQQVQAVKILLKNGADPSLTNNFGQTASRVAGECKMFPGAKDLDKQDKIRKLLDKAVFEQNTK